MAKVIIINGPNLNLLGKREKTIYGDISFETFFEQLQNKFSQHQIHYFQSNVEGELINKLHECGFSFDLIIFNPGGYSHTSVALTDAIAAIKTPVIEVHISNIYAREEFRHVSLTAKNCKGVISGFGLASYEIAIQSIG